MGAAGALLLGGCQSCEEEKPYTPFTVSSAAIPSSPAAPSAEPDGALPRVDSGRFQPVEATAATRETRRSWELGGARRTAPEGHVFELGFAVDVDGNGTSEAVIWTVPEEGSGDSRGALWLYGSGPSTRLMARTPAFVPGPPNCQPRAHLWHSGARSATLRVTTSCETPLIPRSPAGALVVVSLTDAARSPFTLRTAEPAPGESLEISADTSDRDGDGRDDVRLRLELWSREGERPASAELLWLDRAAGFAREPDQPAASFRDTGSIEAVRAKGRNTSARVRGHVDNALRLYATLCAESGVPRIFDAEGSPLGCGDLSLALDRFAQATFDAALTMGQMHEALSVLLRDGWYGVDMSSKLRGELEAAFRKRMPEVQARAVRLSAKARQRTSPFQWAPMRFEDDGALLVMTAGGIVRFDPAGKAAGSADEEIDPWPLTVIGTDGTRWGGLTFPCDRNESVLLRSSPDGSPLPSTPTSLLAPRPGGCAGGSFPDPGPVLPVVWGPAGQQAIVAGTLIEPAADARPSGPKAPLAIASPFGLLVEGPDWEGAALWKVPKAEALGQCEVGPKRTRAACVTDNGTVRLVTPEP